MIAKFIYGHFDKDAIMTVELKASDYTCANPLTDGSGYSLDGGTMIKILVDEQKIQAARLPKFE